jgi:cold shock CspA family protein
MIGQVKFYDEPTEWGLILGSDGALYGVQRARPPLQVGERVRFEPQEAPGGPRAIDVRRLAETPAPRPSRS